MLVVLVFCVFSVAAGSSFPDLTRCETFTTTMCSGLGYNTTLMPNVLNHTTQGDARLEIHQFMPLVKVRCSPDLQKFLCSVYLPECVDGVTTPPSETLCESSRRGCESLMNNFGFLWPDELDCSKFGRVLSTPSVTNTSQHNEAGKGRDKVSSQCEVITTTMCSGLGYNTTLMPNVLNHTTQGDARLEIHQFMPLVKVRCSPDLQKFLCSVYLPECVDGVTTPPSQTLCESSRRGCESLMNNFGFLWPDELDCSKFGRVLSTPSVTKYTSHHNEAGKGRDKVSSQCEVITATMCSGLGYNTTLMPNVLNHTTQGDATLEIHQFMPLVKVRCSPDLQKFLCSVYLPECVDGVTTPPSETLCESSRRGCETLMNNFGFLWPDELDCSKFPVTDVTGSSGTSPTTSLV